MLRQAKMTTNISTVKKSMGMIPAEARKELKSWVTQVAIWTKAELKNAVPVKTGTLKNSIRYRTDYRGEDSIDVKFYWEWYGDILDKGSHFSDVIYPRRAKAFKFTIGGSQVFSKYVHVKPIKARNWSLQVLERAQLEADRVGGMIEARLLGMVKSSE